MKYPVFASLGYFTVVFPPDLLIKGHKPYAAANNSSSSLLLFCQNSARSCWLQLHFCPHLEQGNYVIPFHLETAVQMLMFWGNIFIFLKKKNTQTPFLMTALKRESRFLVPVPVLVNSLLAVLTRCSCSTEDPSTQNICVST